MNKTLIISCLSALLATSAMAQEDVAQVPDTVAVEDIELGIFISEDELMGDYTNRENLTEPATTASKTVSYNDSLLISRLSRIPTTIELPLNDVTRRYIERYANQYKGSVAVMLGAANFYNPIFEDALERYGLPLELRYLPVIESALRPSATSRVGAAGLWQFMIATGKRYGLEVNTLVDDRRDPIKSSEAAAHYLSDLYNMFGDWGLAIAAYNCGEGNVQKALIRNGNQEGADFWTIYNRLPRETRGYVPAFIAATYIMNYYCEHGITPREASLPAESDTIVVQKEVKFSQIAARCGVTVEQLRAINPQYRRDIIPANYTLRLPASAIEEFITMEDSIYGNMAISADMSSVRRAVTDDLETYEPDTSSRNSRSRATRNNRNNRNNRRSSSGGQSVSVKSGDSLSAIARRNGTTVAKLRKLNGLKGDMIRPGQKIRVK